MKGIRSCFIMAVLLLAMTWTAGAQETPQSWGVGGYVDYNLPIFGLRDWFSGGLQGGVVLTYVFRPRLAMELEAHYAKYRHGKLEDRPFVWPVDNQSHASPNASNSMRFRTFLANWLIPLGGNERGFGRGRTVPYFTVGAGFYDYANKISGLIFPGQRVKPLNENLLLEPVKDTRTALGVNLGFGAEIPAGKRMGVDLRGRYNFILGQIRPMTAWNLDEVFLLQLLDVSVRFKIHFSR